MKLEKSLFQVLTFAALYLFGFGFMTELLNLVSNNSPEVNSIMARGVGLLWATIIVITGEFSMTSVKKERKTNPEILDDINTGITPENKRHLYNPETFNKWVRIHYPKEYNGRGEHYVTHMRMEQLVIEYYGHFTFIKNPVDFAYYEGPWHNQFIFDIKSSWMHSKRTV